MLLDPLKLQSPLNPFKGILNSIQKHQHIELDHPVNKKYTESLVSQGKCCIVLHNKHRLKKTNGREVKECLEALTSGFQLLDQIENHRFGKREKSD